MSSKRKGRRRGKAPSKRAMRARATRDLCARIAYWLGRLQRQHAVAKACEVACQRFAAMYGPMTV